MAISEINGMKLVELAKPVATIWGFVCGAFERFLLAPRRRLSGLSAAYFPGMIFAVLAGCCFLIGQGRIQFLVALLMAGAFLFIAAISAAVAFHLSRWIFKTKLTIVLLFGLVFMTVGCASTNPSFSSYFHPTPMDEVDQNQTAQNGNANADGFPWNILYWALYNAGQSVQAR